MNKVQHATNFYGPAATTMIATWGSNTASGNLIALWVYWRSATITISSVTDSQGNTYTPVANKVDGNGRSDSCALYYAKNITGGTTPTVTVTFSASTDGILIVHEISGADTTAPLDQNDGITPQGFNGGGTDAVVTGSITPTSNGQYLFSVASDEGDGKDYTAGTGFTAAPNGHDGAGEYLVQATAAAITGTFTTTGGTWSYAAIMSFKAAGGGGGLSPDKWLSSMDRPPSIKREIICS